MTFLVIACSSPVDTETIAKANSAFEEKHYQVALPLYLQALAKSPKDLSLYIKIAHIYKALGNRQKLEETLVSALEVDNSCQARKKLAELYLASFEPEKAQLHYEAITEALPNDPNSFNGIGVCLDQQGNHKKAKDSYNKALSLAPNDAQIKSNLALSLAFSNKYEEAIRILEPIGLSETATKKQRHNLALVYALANHEDKCCRLLEHELCADLIDHFLSVMTNRVPRG